MSVMCDRRILGGFRCLDGITKRSIVSPLSVTGKQLTLHPNRSGVYAVFDAPGLHKLTTQFLAPGSWPAASGFEVTIEDPALNYLPRRKRIQAPQPLPILAPQDVVLFPTPAAAVAPHWGVVRASVQSNAVPPAGLPWSVLRVVSGSTVLATGMADIHGEALLAVPGLRLQVSASSGGAVTETTTPATLTALFDPSVTDRPTDWIPDPDDILLNLSGAQWKSASQAVELGPGQTVFVTMTISV